MRRIVSTVLILALAAFVSPIPVVAYAPATSSFVQACAPGSTLGCVNGIAQDAAKSPLADHTVRIRNLANNEIVSTTQSATNGAFSFANMPPGNFVFEIVGPGIVGVIATSTSLTVAAGSTATITVTATALTGLAAAGGATGLAGLMTGTSLVVVTAAGVAGIAIAVAATKDDGSPSR
jgi:branched-chain amino acid transport system permease protein